jgi:putative aldouronate transport system substrate-binding protein
MKRRGKKMSKGLKNVFIAILVVFMSLSLFAGCGSDDQTGTGDNEQPVQTGQSDESAQPSEADDDNVSFHSDQPLKFSLLYSSNPDYPYKEDWLIWKAIKDKTNVSFDVMVVPMSDYAQKRSLLISTGDAPYIIPKTYHPDEVQFIPSGAILPVSDYVDKMPNFSRQVKEWGLEDEINTYKQKDGKYYLLPGLHEILTPDYGIAMRTDILEKNNIPLPNTWDEMYEALKKLKQLYPDTYPLSDRYQAKSLLNIAAPTFGKAAAGWGAGDGVYYDRDNDKFIFYPTTDDYKNFLAYFNKLIKEGLMDPESFTQNDDQAIQKFVTGKSFVISANSQHLTELRKTMDETVGKDAYEVKKLIPPAGPAGPVITGSRLENGIMISSKAKDDPNFEQMLKFIDWLWYSDEEQILCKWGVEGTTYKRTADGKFELMPDITFQWMNPSGTKDLRKDFGFGNGVFILMYGGPKYLAESYMSPEDLEFVNEVNSKRELLPAAPPILYDEGEREQANMLSTPLMDYVESMTLKFILGDASLESDWDKYVQDCKQKGSDRLVELANKVYQSTKDVLK